MIESSGWRGLARGALMGTALGTATLGAASLGNLRPPEITPYIQPHQSDTFRGFIADREPVEMEPETLPPVEVSPQQTDPEIQHYKKYIAHSEGFRNRVYNDGRGNLTIGIGHLLKRQDAVLFRHLFGNAVDYNQVRLGKQSLTNDQVFKLFEYDLDIHLKRAKRLFPSFEKYPIYVKLALTDSVFRGDMARKTIQYINAGDWDRAAKEYINRYDYKNRKKLGISGIGPRMERNQQAMLNYAKELRSNRLR
jgi:GH24 family phage-related lysozyme (muramidase)